MEKSDYKIFIIGAGVSGLVAALELESHGYHPIILEASDQVGGRVRTDIVNGYQLDRGFQVMLDAYPKVRQFLDLNALELQPLKPGAVIFTPNSVQRIGDPLRDSSFLWSTITSGIGSFGDKLKIIFQRLLESSRTKDPIVCVVSFDRNTTFQCFSLDRSLSVDSFGSRQRILMTHKDPSRSMIEK